MSFLDSSKAEQMGIIVVVKPIIVGLPNGQQIINSHKCSKFRWQFQNNEFITEVWILPLSKWDAILGVSWLKGLGPVLFDYGNLTLEFTRGDQSVKLQH